MLETDSLTSALDDVVAHARRLGLPFEARAEVQEERRCSLDHTGLRGLSDNRILGVSLRVWADGASGYAASHDLSADAMRRLADDAAAVARRSRGKGRSFPYVSRPGGRSSYRPSVNGDPLEDDVAGIVDLLQRAHAATLEGGIQGYARCAFAAHRRRVFYRDADGRDADTGFALSTLLAQAVHRDGPKPGDGSVYRGGERGVRDFGGADSPEALGAEAARQAIEGTRARPAPAGRRRVLCDNNLTGVLAHESFGHLIEYDVVTMGWSLLAGRRGERFSDAAVSVVDAPEVPGAPRDGIRYPSDEEGVAGRPVRIMEDGVLREFLHVRGSAAEAGDEPTGNGRSQNVRHAPIVRMRNIFIEPGDLTLGEALEELRDGVYLIGSKGGAPGSDGTFMFSSQRGYRVEGGELREPLRGPSISGNIFQFLSGVVGLTRDFRVVSTNFGGCGKWNQFYLPVAWGGPHLLVEEALVGGQEA